MRPPICDVCEAREEGADEDFVTVEFADYRPLPDDMDGHPQGLLWLCPIHDEATRDLRDLESAEAIRIARERRPPQPRAARRRGLRSLFRRRP